MSWPPDLMPNFITPPPRRREPVTTQTERDPFVDHYIIVVGTEISELAESVNGKITQGYRPLGGMAVKPRRESYMSDRYTQTMLKPAEQRPEQPNTQENHFNDIDFNL